MIKDIQAVDAVGGGGIEFIPFYNFGFRDPSFPPWDVFGFGGQRFKEVFLTALKAAEEAGLTFDFSIGANQGQGIPTEPLTPGLAMQLVYGETTVPGGGIFEAALPTANMHYNFELSPLAPFMHKHEEWGADRLVAVVAAGVQSSE